MWNRATGCRYGRGSAKNATTTRRPLCCQRRVPGVGCRGSQRAGAKARLQALQGTLNPSPVAWHVEGPKTAVEVRRRLPA